MDNSARRSVYSLTGEKVDKVSSFGTKVTLVHWQTLHYHTLNFWNLEAMCFLAWMFCLLMAQCTHGKIHLFPQRSCNTSFSVFVSPQMTATPFGGLGAPNMDQMAAMGIPGANMNPQVRNGARDVCERHRVVIKLASHAGTVLSCQALSADFLKLMQSMDPK